MADTALHSMTENTDPAVTDELYLLDDPSGSPADNRISAQNLLKVINNLTEDTAPVRTTDFVVTYDASATASKKVKLQNLSGYVLQADGDPTLNPADATTYYWGGFFGLTLGTTTQRRMYIPRNGVITKCYLYFTGSNGSSETSTVSIRLNDTTDTTVTSTLDMSSLPVAVNNTALSIAVSAGDFISMKWVTPTWATNPTSVGVVTTILIE